MRPSLGGCMGPKNITLGEMCCPTTEHAHRHVGRLLLPRVQAAARSHAHAEARGVRLTPHVTGQPCSIFGPCSGCLQAPAAPSSAHEYSLPCLSGSGSCTSAHTTGPWGVRRQHLTNGAPNQLTVMLSTREQQRARRQTGAISRQQRAGG